MIRGHRVTLTFKRNDKRVDLQVSLPRRRIDGVSKNITIEKSCDSRIFFPYKSTFHDSICFVCEKSVLCKILVLLMSKTSQSIIYIYLYDLNRRSIPLTFFINYEYLKDLQKLNFSDFTHSILMEGIILSILIMCVCNKLSLSVDPEQI